jgi:catechol 2,3-dioxygenase-like lactoylglutathione lyase family enzyme
MRALGIHHVAIAVTDLDDAFDFYEGVLGFPRRHDRPDLQVAGAWLDAGPGQQIHLVVGKRAESVGQHFAVLVEDLDAVVAELREKGLSVSDPVGIGRARQSFVTDPSGNLIELHQPA